MSYGTCAYGTQTYGGTCDDVGLPTRLAAPSKLGCGTHRAFLATREGSLVVELPFSTLRWDRVLDGISNASVTVPMSGRVSEGCCDVLRQLRPWVYHLIIYRQGQEDWVGVCTEPTFTKAGAQIPARDLSQYFERRVLPFDRELPVQDLGDIFRTYANDALSTDDPGIQVDVSDVGVLGSRSVEAADHLRAADEMRELARSGVDYTMVGRRLLGFGTRPVSFALGTHDFLDEPTIEVGGLEAATQVIVQGADREDGTQVYGIAGGEDPTLGLLQVVIDESSIKDPFSAQMAAVEHLRALKPSGSDDIPVTVKGTLHPNAGVGMEDLIPGSRCRTAVETSCRSFIGELRLADMSVTANASESGDTEAVTVTLVS